MFKLTGRGEQGGAPVASDRTTGRTSSHAEMGPGLRVLGDIRKGGVQVETNFPTGFFCDPYVPSDPRSGFVAGSYAPEDLGHNWGISPGENRDGTDILPREGARILSGSPQLRHMEWDDWSYASGRSDGWATGFHGQGPAQGVDPEWGFQYDGQVHSLHGDKTPPGYNSDERQTGVVGRTVLDSELHSPKSIREAMEIAKWSMVMPELGGWDGWDSWDEYGLGEYGSSNK